MFCHVEVWPLNQTSKSKSACPIRSSTMNTKVNLVAEARQQPLCGTRTVLTDGESSSLISRNYPQNFPSLHFCRWTFRVSSAGWICESETLAVKPCAIFRRLFDWSWENSGKTVLRRFPLSFDNIARPGTQYEVQSCIPTVYREIIITRKSPFFFNSFTSSFFSRSKSNGSIGENLPWDRDWRKKK